MFCRIKVCLRYTLLFIMIFAINASVLSATIYDCSTVGNFKAGLRNLEREFETTREEARKLKKRLTKIPTDDMIATAEAELKRLETEVNNIKAAAKPAPSTSTGTSTPTSPEIQTLNSEITKLTNDIADLDKKINTIKADGDTYKQNTQKEADQLMINSVNPQIGNIVTTMPSKTVSSVKNSTSLSNWIIDQENRTSADTSVTRNNVKVNIPFNQLTAEELFKYKVVISRQINVYKGQLKTLFDRRDTLQQKTDDGTITPVEQTEYRNGIPNQINVIKPKLYNEFENEFTDVLTRLRDLKGDIPNLKKIEDKITTRASQDKLAIENINKKKTPLIAQKQTKEKERDEKIRELQASASTPATASGSGDLATAQAATDKQRDYVAALKSNKKKWDETYKEFDDARTALKTKKQEEANFDVDVSYSEKKAVKEASAKAKAAREKFNSRRNILRKRFKIFSESLTKKRDKLTQKANQLVKQGKYNEATRNKLLAEWETYKQELNKRAAPQRKNAKKTMLAAANQVRDAARSLNPYNCKAFPQAVALRNRLAGIFRKLVQQSRTTKPDILDAPINLPAIQARNITGYWNSNHGCTTFRQKGNQVNGMIRYQNGFIGYTKGSLVGKVYSFRWWNTGDRGRGRLTLSADDRKLTGRYRDVKGRSGNWNLAKRSSPCKPIKKRKPKSTKKR